MALAKLCAASTCRNTFKGSGAYCQACRDEIAAQPKPNRNAKRREYEQGKPSAWRRGYNSEYQRNRKTLLEHNPFCWYCLALLGISTPSTTADHRIPVSQGVDNSYSNLIPCCRSHQQRRGNMPFETFVMLVIQGRK